ncbi:MAG: PaaI family thioesterase [Pseudomonadota bacterium]
MASVITCEEVNAFFRQAFPQLQEGLIAEELGDGTATVRCAVQDWMLRPGELISGPAQFTLADTATYTAVFTKLGITPMAVTTNTNINFLSPCPAGDVRAKAELVKLGRRTALAQVEIYGDGQDHMASHAMVSFALPQAKGM